MYILQLMDSYAPSYGLLVVGFCECIVIAYVYGMNYEYYMYIKGQRIHDNLDRGKQMLERLAKAEGADFPYPVKLEDFVHFVTKLKGGRVNDPHWSQQLRMCNFCSERLVSAILHLH